MALPIRDYVASQAVETALQKARILRDNVTRWKAQVGSSATSGDIVINAAQGIKQTRDQLAALAAVSGLDAAAKTQYNDSSLTLTAELAAVVAACDGCLSWIVANYPKDASGYLLDRKIVNGAIEHRTFSVSAMSGLSQQFALLLAAFSSD